MAAVSRTAHIFTDSIIYMYDVCCAGTTLATKRIKQPAELYRSSRSVTHDREKQGACIA